ncbi:hypothetical protein H9Q72_011470 [Fusarium xylarioides]|uniref:Uncharacterized protein n=1 Tax=Fusarium xylarioides TaxID=221167 RepID=A0A9P7HIY0_9HYPO|nr:hypothetical protein H9Q72_011470 [Fusarium xylarioides]
MLLELDVPTENNETPLPPIPQDFLDRWAANGKAKEIFEPPHDVSRKSVSVWKKHPDSITEEMLDEDDNAPMSDEEEDHGEDTDHHLSTDNPTIHVHGGEATMKADDDDKAAIE